MGLIDAPSYSRAQANALFMPSGGGLSTLTSTPLVFAHRFGGNYYPEDTIEAARAAFGLGPDALDTDAYLGADSCCPIMHDSTVDRTTTSSGNTNDLAAGTVAQLLTETTLVPGWGACHVPTFGDVCREFGNRIVLSVESKVAGAAAGLSAIAKRFRVDNDHLFWQSFIAAECDVFVAQGYTNVCILSGDGTYSAATAVAKGYTWVGVDASQASTSVIATYHAAGLKVGVYTINSQKTAATWIAAGVDLIWSDDFAYVTDRQTTRTADPFASKAIWPGQLIPTTRTDYGSWSSTNEWGIQSQVNQYDEVLQGWATPYLKSRVGNTLTITGSGVFDWLNDSDTTRWTNITLRTTDDWWTNGSRAGVNGYQFWISAGGSMRIYKITDGVATQLGSSVASGALTLGTFFTWKIEISSTNVKFTRTDIESSNVVNQADATYRDLKYMTLGRSGATFRHKQITLAA